MRSGDEWWESPKPTVGNASGSTDQSGDVLASADFAGVIIVPDVEARRGWREYFVKRAVKPNGRSIGFRR